MEDGVCDSGLLESCWLLGGERRGCDCGQEGRKQRSFVGFCRLDEGREEGRVIQVCGNHAGSWEGRGGVAIVGRKVESRERFLAIVDWMEDGRDGVIQLLPSLLALGRNQRTRDCRRRAMTRSPPSLHP